VLDITIKDGEAIENIETEGCLLLFLDDKGNMRTTGKINLKAMTPLLTKIILEKMNK
jgi:uncharacterized protein YuzE